MFSDKLVIGLPAGSLADPSRGGNLITLLKNAGFPTKGYDKGGPTSFPLDTMLMGWDGRPQEFGSQLGLNELDLAISGNDWIHERVLEFKYEYGVDITLEKILPLQRGNVRIVIIARPETKGTPCDEWLTGLLSSKPLVSMVSEMPYLALEWFQNKCAALGFADSHKKYSVQKFKTPSRIDSGLVIYETWGKTEAKVTNASVDFGLEITQTGSAIQSYGLSIVDEIMPSETSIWINPAIRENPVKRDLARMFVLNLYGAINAENKVLILFNTRKENVANVLEYLKQNALYADEPTVNEGLQFTEFSVQLDTANPALPVAKVRYELAKLGATHIETIPVDSSIPGVDVLPL